MGIGETVFDIIFKNGQPQAAKAGGAMLKQYRYHSEGLGFTGFLLSANMPVTMLVR